jgi:tetratricopeptide (TPR) repeat protein
VKKILMLWAFILLQTFSIQVFASDDVGRVNFTISCKPASQAAFNRALALTHHMMYVQAEKLFTSISKDDPNCAMAYWGIALTQIHPLWSDKPNDTVMKKGAAAIKKAESLKHDTPEEKAFINALAAFYNNWQSTPYEQRIKNWKAAQKKVFQQYPSNPEAVAFYSLLHLATAPKDDKSFKHQRKAGKLLERLHAKFPRHPGGFHYTIHAYDNPALAAHAETIARNYSPIAPKVPHALHMPSHIFVRLGLWPEVISWNIRSEQTAKSQPLKNGVMSMHYAHALDYLMYAYLQTAQYEKAEQVLARVDAVKQFQDSFPTAYGAASAPARYYVEQGLWTNALKLNTELPKNYPWDKYPYVQSIIYFAQGLAAINLGKPELAQTNIDALKKVYDQLKNKKQNYWATLVNAKIHTLAAWLEFKDGDKAKALKAMRVAAKLEDSVDKHPVTPGEVLPAREMLGDMLLQMNRPQQALQAYRVALKISPNRLHSLYGAGFAAEQLKQKKLALKYYGKLVRQTEKASTQTPEIKHAKAYLAADK